MPRARTKLPVDGTLLAAALAFAGACSTVAPPAAMTFEEAGFQQAPARPAIADRRGSLDVATDALLLAIERETGERPALSGDDAPLSVQEVREARHLATGWTAERTTLAMELLRATDTREASVRAICRARAALQWDLALGARWTDVDALLVQRALARADDVVPPLPIVRLLPPRPGQAPIDDSLAFAWPLRNIRVSSPFGERIDPLGEGPRRHTGIDLASPEGAIVTASAPGVVVFAGLRGGYGLHVEVRHASGFVTRYAHLSRIAVRPGELVAGGAPVGLVGHTGRATGPHLHFELWRGGLPIDPAEALPEDTSWMRRSSYDDFSMTRTAIAR